MRIYALVALAVAAVTWLMVPLARRLAIATGGFTEVRDRDIHTVPTPRMGGLAMLIGAGVGMVIASHMPFLAPVFVGPFSPWPVLAAGAVVCVVGLADDIWDLDWVTKLVGQVMAAWLLGFNGYQMVSVPTGDSLIIGSSRLSLLLTIFVVVVAMNAVNFVDGLDGLAAGLVAIGAGAFFCYTYLISMETRESYASQAALILAITLGMCLGFLPHNFHPASLFMGDSGSMLLGLFFAAATIGVTGQIDPALMGTDVLSRRQTFPVWLPLMLPLAVLALPLLDMILTVWRRVRAGQSPFHADRQHLHHKLLELGHTHRRAVLIMYMWTAVFAFGMALLAILETTEVAIILGLASAVCLVVTLVPLRHRLGSRKDSAR